MGFHINTVFIDREAELELLKRFVKERGIILVYGRRRVGKTRLLLEFIRRFNGKVLYHLCIDEPISLMLKRISRKLYKLFNDEVLLYRPLNSFDEFFNYLSDKELVIIFDEFPILVMNYPRITGLLQEFIDLHSGRVSIILCGSYISMMEKLVSYASPLYGRRVATIKLEPLKFYSIRGFFPNKDWIELAYIYSVTDGIPEYILWFNRELSFRDNLLVNVLRKGCYLYDEAEKLLRYELRDLTIYNAILEALASGYNRLHDICSKTGFDRTHVIKYISVLYGLGIVDYIQSIHLGIKERLKARNRLYFIKDNYFNFYYRYIFPYKEMLEQELVEDVIDIVLKDYDSYMGFIFEKIALELLIEFNKRGLLKHRFKRVGRYWYRDVEIDIVTIDDELKQAVFYEVKWSRLKRRDVERIIDMLIDKSLKTKWAREYSLSYGVIAREYSESVDDLLEEGYTLLELRDFNKIVGKH